MIVTLVILENTFIQKWEFQLKVTDSELAVSETLSLNLKDTIIQQKT